VMRGTPVWNALPFLCLGWGTAWAVGLTTVYVASSSMGWILAAGLAGFTIQATLRAIVPFSPRKRQLLLLAWIGGGLIASFEVNSIFQSKDDPETR
jgi:hypothetical protein